MQSMTGYGSSMVARDGREMRVELKAVNHRFLDITVRVPKSLTFLEEPLRKCVVEGKLARGHVDVFVTYQNHREDARQVQLDMPLFMSCASACAEATNALHGRGEATIAEILTLCSALTVTQGEEDAQAVTEMAREAAGQAVQELLAMRRCEGEALGKDLNLHLHKLKELTQNIQLRAPDVPKLYQERLNARLKEWDVPGVDPGRIAQEVALMADRCAIDEELSRLESHMVQFADGLLSTEEIGRKLDFLLQEMNREVNTIGSKASDESITMCVVDAKCVIEKLREQVQNAV